MATYAIGDLQGCFEPLQRLVASFEFNPLQDTLWFVGDLVNRGPDSLAVLRWIYALPNKIVVLGNHDIHLLVVKENPYLLQPEDTLQEILQADDGSELCNWLRQQPLIYHDKSLGYTMVHAGIPPQWDLNTALQRDEEITAQLRGVDYKEFLRQVHGDEPTLWSDDLIGVARWRYIVNAFTRMRFCTSEGELNIGNTTAKSSQAQQQPWFSFPHRLTKNEKIIFGHWAALMGKTNNPHAIGLDTGCVWGNQLTAMRLEDRRFFSVDANRLNQR